MSDAFVAIGSNIDAEENIPAALRYFQSLVNVRAASTFYQTPAVDDPWQPSFANGVWRIDTDLGPRRLKYDVCRAVESMLGRVRTPERFAPRTIDLDLILYDDLVINESGLILPAPEIRTRSFVAVPLLELAPECALPDTGEVLSSLPVSRDSLLEAMEELTETLRSIIRGGP